jgi:hypothetical protein
MINKDLEDAELDDGFDNEGPSPGDELYISLGLDPVSSLSSTLFLVPKLSGGDCITAIRLEAKFFNDENWCKIIPLEDFITMISSLSGAVMPETIKSSVHSIALITATKEDVIGRLEKSKSNIDNLIGLFQTFRIKDFAREHADEDAETDQR